MFPYWFSHNDGASGLPYTYPETLDGSSVLTSGITSYFAFNNQAILDIFNTILQMLYNDSPNWFYRVNMDTDTILLSKTPATAQHQFVIAQHIAEPSFAKDATGLKNVILVTGNTNAVQAVARGSDISTYGVRTLRVSESRLTNNAQAQTLADGLLVNKDQVLYRFKIRVMDYRGDTLTGMGYDIETIKVGDSCQLINPTVFPGSLYAGGSQAPSLWDSAIWDSSLWNGSSSSFLITPVMQIVSLSYGFDYVDLEIGAFAPNQDVTLLQLQNSFQDWTVGVA